MKWWHVVLPLSYFIVAGLSGCTSSPPSRYSVDQDHGPQQPVDLDHVPDAVPHYEPLSRMGNAPSYQVLGKTYRVLPQSSGFREQGVASWYGAKFHGHKTSNGEVYDMYGMSAAHKHLPLPTFVRVTNLANNRQVVVRVNDRGPFHEGRVIDLSYAAAYRLDMLANGTARVLVEAIDVPHGSEDAGDGIDTAPAAAQIRPKAPLVLQVGAFSSWSAAQALKTRLSVALKQTPISISQRSEGEPLYRVRVGPFADSQRQSVEETLAAEGLSAMPVVDLP